MTGIAENPIIDIEIIYLPRSYQMLYALFTCIAAILENYGFLAIAVNLETSPNSAYSLSKYHILKLTVKVYALENVYGPLWPGRDYILVISIIATDKV